MTYVSTVLADNPYHFWRLADPGGQLAHDVGSGTQRALKTTSPFFGLGYSGPNSDGGSAFLDNSTTMVHSTLENISSPVSFELLIWFHNLPAAQTILLSHYANLQTTAADHILFASGGPNVTAPAVFTEQAWHHIVGTYGAVGGAKLYIDGVNVATAAYTGAWGPQAAIVAVASSGVNTLFTSAQLAELAIYHTELSAAQVTAHFNAIDQVANRPVFGAFGQWKSADGSVILSPVDVAAILAAVRKTY